MAQRLADSAAVSVFCDSVALMLSVGIQTDEAVHMLSEDMGDTSFGKTCNKIYRSLIAGKSLAQSMKDTGAFPRYATDMVEVGERSGHSAQLERLLQRGIASVCQDFVEYWLPNGIALHHECHLALCRSDHFASLHWRL